MRVNYFFVEDSEGQKRKWGFWHEPHAVSTTKAGRVPGWVLQTHDGYNRFCEGNWRDFVPFVHEIAHNYGCKCKLS